MKKINSFNSFLTAAFIFAGSFAFTSCEDKNEGPSGAYAEDGVFIVNEGNFGTPNGSISYYNTSTKEVQNGIFSKENEERPLGDVVQNMAIHSDKAYIVANNSNKIEVVNAYTFKSEGVIEGLQLPRYFTAFNNSKGYVTEWVNFGEGRVSVIDLATNTVTKTIAVGIMPEQLLLVNGKLYVANSGGNDVSVINTSTDTVEKTITVPDAPGALVLDKNNSIWVLSSGKLAYNSDWTIDYTNTTAGALSVINPGTQALQSSYTFPGNQSQPSNLAISAGKDKIYFNYAGKTFVQNTTATSLSNTVLINRSFYGLDVDPETGLIYGGDANGFAGDGTVYIYNPDGSQVGTFKAGIAPNGFVFN
ncbi:YncE family protein [Pontibacter locisalis]|uniref:YncE family protein n=1 Tax=Pontibacter locisalis TaxID=1719035 RepID=A0ABW5IIT1_9BACT